MEKRLKILFMSGWYQYYIDTGSIFIREHAKAASLHDDVVILYSCADPYYQPKGLFRIIEDEKDGVKTCGVTYGGTVLNFFRKLTRGNRPGSGSSAPPTDTSILNKVLLFPRFVVVNSFYYWGLFAGFRKLAKEGWKPDIIHTHVSTTGLPAILLGKIYKIPVIVTEHWSAFPKRTLTRVELIKARYVMNRAKVVLPVSNFLKQAIEDYGIKGHFCIIPNTINMENFYPLPAVKRSDDSKKRLLLVANLIPQKGIPELLNALNRIGQKRNDFILDLVGPEIKPYDYEKLAHELKLDNVVEIHKGFKTSEEVGNWMRRCDFFVLPSLMETFGVVYIEAMACGKPVIGMDLPVLREIIDQETGLLVPLGNDKALDEAIETMLDNCRNYSPEKIIGHVRLKYNYKNVGAMLNRVYNEALGGNAASD
jgi:L-malate glycosyltransferase